MSDIARIDHTPVEKQFATPSEVVDCFALTPEEARTVHVAYRTYRDLFGPFASAVAGRMLTDLRSQAALAPSRTQVLFSGRNGHYLAAAARALDPEFFGEHCFDLVLSRQLTFAALMDVETRSGERVTQSWEKDPFRRHLPHHDWSRTQGAHESLVNYLSAQGVRRGRGVHLGVVDHSHFEGSTIESLRRLVPAEYSGYFTVAVVRPGESLAGKRGYVLHHTQGRNRLVAHWDPSRTYMGPGNDTLEAMLRGPWSRIRTDGNGGTVQHLEAEDNWAWPLVNPVRVHASLRRFQAQQAVHTVALLGVYDHAKAVADGAASAEPWYFVKAGQDPLTRAVRGWVRRDPRADPRLVMLADAFAPRMASADVMRTMNAELATEGIPREAAMPLWRVLDAASPDPERQRRIVDGWLDGRRLSDTLERVRDEHAPATSTSPRRTRIPLFQPPRGLRGGRGAPGQATPAKDTAGLNGTGLTTLSGNDGRAAVRWGAPDGLGRGSGSAERGVDGPGRRLGT